MRTIVKGKNLEVAESDREYALQKLHRLERLLDDRTDALVELSTESHRSTDNGHIVEVTLVIDGRTLRGEASAPSYRAAIDEVIDKLERRAVAHKRRPLANRRSATLGEVMNPDEGDDGAADDDTKPQIVTIKRFAIEPMFEEDAVARMEELGHSFFVFVNAENEQLGVLYRRADGNYGLIEPTVGGEYTRGQGGRGRREAG